MPENDENAGVIDPEEQIESGYSLPIKANMITYLPSYAREHSSTWIHFDSAWARSRVNLRLTRVHGTYDLPEGYEFAIVPRNTFLISQVASNTQGDPRLTSEISAGYSVLKAVASLIQVVAAFTTLLSHRPDLIRRWGYASYHLTVIPYLAMTLVNLISNMVAPDYPCLYMIRSETMVEAEKAGGRFEGEIAQMISLLPRDETQVEDPAWSGLTNKGIQDFSNTLASTASEIYVLDITIRLLYRIITRKTKKKPSAKDAKIIQLEVVSNFNPSPTPLTDDSEIEAPQANMHVDPSGTNLPNAIISSVDNSKTVLNQDILTRSLGSPSSGDEYQIQIPRAPRLSLGKGFLYTMRRVLEDLSSAKGKKMSSFFTILQNMQENTNRLRAYPSSGSYLHQTAVQYKYALKGHLIPLSSDDDAEFTPVRSAVIYHPNCQRFLRWDDFAKPPKINKEKSEMNQLKTSSPIIEGGEATLAASISNIRTLLQLPNRPVTSTPSITELEELLQSPAIARTSGRTGWALLVEIGISACVVGLFFGLIAGLTKFHAGPSSATERGIMMTWLASGLYGFCLPLLSTLELLKVLFLFPVILSLSLAGIPEFLHHSLELHRTLRDNVDTIETTDRKRRSKTALKAYAKFMSGVVETMSRVAPQPATALLYMFAFVPLGIFIPPIWEFVLVGRMLTEWGDCVRLY